MLAAGAAAVAVVAATAVLYSQRGPIGTRLAVDYLAKRGVPAVIQIERISPRGFVGSARLGPARDPDLTIERIEVVFEPFPVVRDGLAPRIRSIRMVRPMLKARYVRGRLNFGSLQPLIDEFLAQPVTGPPPDVLIEDGAARIATEVGELRLAGAGALTKGRLVRLDARMGAHRLARGDARFELDGAALQLRGANDRLTGRFNAALPLLVQGGATLRQARLTGALDLPYGTGERPFEGRVGLETTIDAERMTVGDSALSGGRLVVALGGLSRGGPENLTLDGRGNLAFEAARLDGPTAAQGLRWSAGSDTLHLARTQRGVSFSGPMRVGGQAAELRTAEARLRDVRLTGATTETSGNLDTTGVRLVSAPRVQLTAGSATIGGAAARNVRLDLGSPDLTLASVGEGPRISGMFDTRLDAGRVEAGGAALRDLALRGRGEADTVDRAVRLAWRGSVRSAAGTSAQDARRLAAQFAPIAGDPAAFSRLLQTLNLDAPDVRLEATGASGVLSLGAPASLRGDGGEIVVRPVAATPLAEFGPDGLRGGLTLVSAGAALPAIEVEAPAYRIGQDGLTANVRLSVARLNAGPLQGAVLRASGRVAPVQGGSGFFASDCATFAADSVSGEDGVVATGISAQACPVGERPLVASGPRGWEAHAGLRDADARLPTAEIEVADAAGVVDVSGGPQGLTGGVVRLSGVTLADRAAAPRFLAVEASGAAQLDGQTWTGAFDVADAAGDRKLAVVKLRHDMTSGAGSAEVEAQNVAFAQGGFQPAQITPLAAQVLSDAQGAASFSGVFAWDAEGLTSRGRVSTDGLSFRASMGQVQGLKGSIELTSLAPVATAPEQSVTIEHIDWLVPLDQASLTLTVTPTAVRIVKAQVGVGGGQVLLDPLDLKLGALLPTSGTLRLADVDLGRLVSQFNLADKVAIEAKVDGVLPFAFTAEGLRFSDGRIFADGPGRLSIKREALTGVAATDASVATTPNAMQSFAYQAMENLAFSQMDARITSQPQGRLGVLFHINGRHDPPVGQTPRVRILDLLRGRAFERDLPLPKGTPVDLTLDTSLNFDELMAAYSGAGRSTAVQP